MSTVTTRARRRTGTAPRPKHAPGLVPLADEGIVVAIVAVTGTDDHVGDVIAPGAFAKTLKTRRPKVCFNHSWADPLGRVLHIVELMPGDARLPKVLPDGRAWPRAAGAVIATMQFHMTTERGREMFAHAKEWAAAGEAAFSIGYKAVPGRTSKRADGVRVIYELELFELSLVLHGAHDMALALEVKDAMGGAPERETLTAPAGLTTVVEPETQPDFTDSSMLALYPSPEVAAQIAVEGGTLPEDLHVTVAFLGDSAQVDPTALVGALSTALSRTGELSGQVGGLGMFPEGDNGTPVWVPVDVPGLDALRTAAVDALEAAGFPQQSEHGFTPHMTLGYDLDAVDPVPPVPVTFTEAVLVVGTDKHPIPLAGPNPAPMEGKAAIAVRAARAERVMSNLEHKSATQIVLEAKSLPPMESKTMNRLSGSYEDLREKLSMAVDTLFAKPPRDAGDGMMTEGGHSYIEATFPDQVVVCNTDYSKSPESRETTYVIPYTVTPDGKVELGTPEEARIEVTLSDATPDNDGDLPVVHGEEAGMARFALPLADMLSEATSLAAFAPEGKSLADTIRPALDALLDQLAVKGLPYSPDPIEDEDEEDWDALAAEIDGDAGDEDPDDEDDTDLRAALGDELTEDEPTDDELDDEDDEPIDGDVVVLDPSEIDADLASIDSDAEPLDEEPLL